MKVWNRWSFFCRLLMSSRAKGWLLQKVPTACFIFSSSSLLNWIRNSSRVLQDRFRTEPEEKLCHTYFYSLLKQYAGLTQDSKSSPIWSTTDVSFLLRMAAICSEIITGVKCRKEVRRGMVHSMYECPHISRCVFCYHGAGWSSPGCWKCF